MKTLKDLENKLKTLNEEFAEFKKSCRKAPEVGEIIEIAGMKWKVLDKLEEGYFCITEGFESLSTEFDSDTNNWSSSELRNYLNTEIAAKIENEIGEGKLIDFRRDLLSLDGQTEYGECTDKVSLLTVDEYRKYRELLPNTGKWWWLCTPWSTPCNGYKHSVTIISPRGGIFDDSCSSDCGVRPVCIFPFSIFVSEEGESNVDWN